MRVDQLEITSLSGVVVIGRHHRGSRHGQSPRLCLISSELTQEITKQNISRVEVVNMTPG